MSDQNTTMRQPQVGSDGLLGVGALIVLSFGDGAEEATIEAKSEDRYLIRWKRFGREIKTLDELKARRFIVLPPRAPRRSWWARLFTPNDEMRDRPDNATPQTQSTTKPE